MDYVNLTSETDKKHHCNLCGFHCCKIGDYNRHILTRKHLRLTNVNSEAQPITSGPTTYNCICGNKYKHQPSLCKHKRTCQQILNPAITISNENINFTFEQIPEPINTKNELDAIKQRVYSQSDNTRQITPELLYEIIKQNQQLQTILLEERNEMKNFFVEHSNRMIELSQKPSSITNTNNNNQHFNMNIFLNEKCKNALNVQEFVQQLVFDADTVQYSGTHGFVAGVTHVITTGLNKLDQYTRPFHCADLKREIMYVKVDDKWLKDQDGNVMMMNVINHVVARNMGQIPAWAEAHPESNIVGSDLYEEQFTLLREVTGGSGDRYRINTEKVFRILAKETLIDKMNCM